VLAEAPKKNEYRAFEKIGELVKDLLIYVSSKFNAADGY